MLRNPMDLERINKGVVEIQRIDAMSALRKRMTLINWLVLLPLPFTAIYNVPLVYSISLILVLFAVGLSLIPKMMELSNEQKPLW
ncbi:hypothetical protein BBH88_14050 [Planococcus antarcticus DSM 14505]|uniref:Uncharacterized protein n=2 Tax=Planococcus TaxID=1372 RepID=A0ABM6D7D0_9BACL|nr:hypothetical protein BBH88_14050 [Planococcus antarcticus DSM 14505]